MADDKAHQGIQKLLTAEHEAMEVVAAAKADKVNRLKQAKQEAEGEIAAYKADREAQFKIFATERGSGATGHASSLNTATEKELVDIANQVALNKNTVIDMLLKSVTSVQ
mmetsp:Transcript_28086/g.82185  ORF Transcript_28086/g.82185 Transcript_28086/m.82185 type:complete len:110 (-) Transcript_28086:210-539(-)